MNVPFLKKITENHIAVLMTFVLLLLLVLLKVQEDSSIRKITEPASSELVTSIEYLK